METILAACVTAVPATIAALAAWRSLSKRVDNGVIPILQDILKWQSNHELFHQGHLGVRFSMKPREDPDDEEL